MPATKGFVDLYVAGDDEAAKDQFPDVRTHYERIEPVAEALGDLDPRIDYREVDAKAEGLEWTGFHRIEKDLWEPAKGTLNADGETDAWQDWQPSTPEQRADLGKQLVDDVTELYDYVHSADFTTYLDDQGVDWLSNGAMALLDEVASGKITGEEDWWSGTDLWDFAANVEGSKMAFTLVRDFAVAQGDDGIDLVERIDKGYTALEERLAKHGDLAEGVRDVQRADRRGQARSDEPDQRAGRAALAADEHDPVVTEPKVAERPAPAGPEPATDGRRGLSRRALLGAAATGTAGLVVGGPRRSPARRASGRSGTRD